MRTINLNDWFQPRPLFQEFSTMTYKDDEIASEKKIQCPRCAQDYGYVAMNKNFYQTLQRVTDKLLICVVCGYRHAG